MYLGVTGNTKLWTETIPSPCWKSRSCHCHIAWVLDLYTESFLVTDHCNLRNTGGNDFLKYPDTKRRVVVAKPYSPKLYLKAWWRSWCLLRWGSLLRSLGYFFQDCIEGSTIRTGALSPPQAEGSWYRMLYFSHSSIELGSSHISLTPSTNTHHYE